MLTSDLPEPEHRILSQRKRDRAVGLEAELLDESTTGAAHDDRAVLMDLLPLSRVTHRDDPPAGQRDQR